MDFLIEKNVELFLKTMEPWLRENPVANNRLLSELYRAQAESHDVHCMAVLEEGVPVIAALQTAPNNIMLTSEATKGSLKVLAENFLNFGVGITGMVGPIKETKAFAELHKKTLGQPLEKMRDEVVYKIEELVLPEGTKGEVAFATEADLEIVAPWLQAFAKEALHESEHLTDEEAREVAGRHIVAGGVALWKVEGRPVAVAGFGSAKDIARINSVYTPEEHRGKGYAKATVAHLTKHLLESGTKVCCLYADAENPAANKAYQNIGYKEVMRSARYVPAKL